MFQIDIFFNGKQVEEMSVVAHKSKSVQVARRMLEKLQKDVPRQLINIAIQAKIRNKIVARADIKPVRKDVTAKCVRVPKYTVIKNT